MKSCLLFILYGFLIISGCSKGQSPESYLSLKEKPLPLAAEEPDGDRHAITHEEATFLWISQMQQENGLLESAEFTDFVSLYDNSLAALAFLQAGKIEKAEKVFDYFNDRMQEELLANPGGIFQFRKRDGTGGSRSWLGDNAWLLIALNHYHELTGSDTYTLLAKGLDSWIRSLQDTDGGLWGGWNADGSKIPKVTEGIITAYNAVTGFDEFHHGILGFLQEQRWDEDAMAFITQNETPDYRFALDLHSLGFLIFKDLPPMILDETERYQNTQFAALSGAELNGYCFDEDRDVIWLEGTAQMAVAFQEAGRHNQKMELLQQLEKTFIHSSLAEGAKGLPYTTNQGTNFGATLLWDHADLTPALSSSIWYLFARANFNPMLLGTAKKTGVSENFWLKAM